MSAAPRIDARVTHKAPPRTSLGIYANTVNQKAKPKPSPKTKAARDEAFEQTKAARYQLQRAAQALLPGERVKHCCRSTMSTAGVVVYRSAEGASYGNLSTCGSTWHCPICNAKITEKRRQELQSAVNDWAMQGGEVCLMSLTFPHSIDQALAGTLNKFADALKKFKNSKTYKGLMREAGSVGSIRALEVTHGAHGWHPHTHDLVFVRPGYLDKLRELQMVWIDALIQSGIAERSQLNDMLKAAFDIQNGDYAAEYVAKFGHEATEASKALTDNRWGASHELTKAHAKVGKRLGGRTPFTLLLDYIKGDDTSGALFQEFAICFKGKRQLFWSPKLKPSLAVLKWAKGKTPDEIRAVGLDVMKSGAPVLPSKSADLKPVLILIGLEIKERTDEEIAADEELPDREFVMTLDHAQWNLVLSRNARFEVLRAAQDGGEEGVQELLLDLEARRKSHQGIHSERWMRGWYTNND